MMKKYNQIYKKQEDKWVLVGYVCPSCNMTKQSVKAMDRHYLDKCPKNKKQDKEQYGQEA